MKTIKLYHMNFSRSTMALWMLEEIGQPYTVELVEKHRKKRGPALEKANPFNKVPTLEIDGSILSEAAAICLYLAEIFPKSGLHVKTSSPLRGSYLKWAFLCPSCLEPALLDRMYKRKPIPTETSGWATPDKILQQISFELTEKKYILGDQFTAADVILSSHLDWGVMTKLIEPSNEIKNYLSQINRRPARIHTIEMEERKSWPLAEGQ